MEKNLTIVSEIATSSEILEKYKFYYWLALLLGILWSLYLIPLNFIMGDARIFEQGDFAQNLSGWYFYRSDSWHLPLLRTYRLNAPEGISVAFTDSIPLFALIFKAMHSWLPTNFQYFGIWLVLVFTIQSIAGVFLIRSLGCKQWYAAIAGAVFASISPVLAWRIGHSALMAHALILLALGAYFRGTLSIWNSQRATRWLAGIAILGLLIHPYWLALCFGILVAFLFDDARRGNNWRIQFNRILITLSCLLIIMWTAGYGGSSVGAEGFGLYSMNFVSPVCGGRLTPCLVDATGGQYEGFNYLGAGVLLMASYSAVSFITSKNNTRYSLFRKHLGIILLAIALTVYALSNKIFFGSIQVLHIPLPDLLLKLASVFRASGRFFWVVGYLITFVSLAYFIHKFKGKWYVYLVLALLPVQWWDVQSPWHRLQWRVSEPAKNDLASWSSVVSDIEHVNLHPAFGCKEGDIDQYFFYTRLAAHYGLILDTGYIARVAPNCAEKSARFSEDFEHGQLYVLAAPYFKGSASDLPKGFRKAMDAGECVQFKRALLCKPGMNLDDWRLSPLAVNPVGVHGRKHMLRWEGAELISNNGVVVDGELRPKNASSHDFMSSGPYAVLPAGRYRAQIQYRSDLSTAEVAGAWDAVAAPIGGQLGRTYANGNMVGTGGDVRSIVVDVDVAPEDGPLELRTIYPGQGGDLAVLRVMIEAVGP